MLKVVAREELKDAAFGVAYEIAAKDPVVIRAAKESLNGIDPWDVKRSYRYEQGFTFELNLNGVAGKVRDEFGGRETGTEASTEASTEAGTETGTETGTEAGR